jgi:hypothetical protein
MASRCRPPPNGPSGCGSPHPGRTLYITVEPFGRLTTWQLRQLDDQVGRIGEFLEHAPRLAIGTVTAGSHA